MAGLPEEVYWNATPLEYAVLKQAQAEREERFLQEFRFGFAQVVSLLFNIHRGEDTEPVFPEDLVPGMERRKPEEKKEPEPATPEQVVDFFAGLGVPFIDNREKPE